MCVRSLIDAIRSGITWSNDQAKSARTGCTIWMYTISGAQATNVMPRNATKMVFVWIAATSVIHQGEFGSEYTVGSLETPFTAVRNVWPTVWYSSATMIRIGRNVHASPPSMEYQFLRVPACRISPARLVENHTHTPKAMNAPEATMVLCQSVPPERLTPAEWAFWMKKW